MIEAAWARVHETTDHEGAIRIDPKHGADYFAAQDGEGRLGMILLLDDRPPKTPPLEAVDIDVAHRSDGRWSLQLWLGARNLATPFAQLCDDLIESSRGVERDRLGQFVVGRLRRWRELLDAASLGWSMSKLRGFIAELLVLRAGWTVFGGGEMVRGWRGPFSAPQDFALPGLWIEVKATFPSARSVRITSADQLAAPGRLVLAVHTLATLLPDDEGITAAGLVAEIEARIKADGDDSTLDDFVRRLAAVGYDRTGDYTRIPFRSHAEHYYEVADGFPRITPATVSAGIAEVLYDLDLGVLPPFETTSPLIRSDGTH